MKDEVLPLINPAALNRHAKVIEKLKHITRHADETEDIRVENLIGFSQVPTGLAGPLRIDGHSQKAMKVFAPLATVEATLVASVNRGCKAFQACGGIKAVALGEGMGRAPVFVFHNVDDAVAFYKRLPDLEPQLRKDAEATSRHARLIRITAHIIGKSAHVHFEYTCGDAAGQNMAAIATFAACSALFESRGEELRILKVYPEGNLSADKKGAAARGVRPPRGVQVMAWGVISDDVCKNVLRCTAAEAYDGLRAGQEGAIRNSLQGNSINAANVVTAMFIATGQDAACIVESCWAHFTLDYDQVTKDLTASIFFPSMIVGTIGGGTGYSTQKEALEMLGCQGAGRKWALAETIAAFALACDASVGCAVASNTHTASHQRFARAKL